jgi:hypothetical protein
LFAFLLLPKKSTIWCCWHFFKHVLKPSEQYSFAQTYLYRRTSLCAIFLSANLRKCHTMTHGGDGLKSAKKCHVLFEWPLYMRIREMRDIMFAYNEVSLYCKPTYLKHNFKKFSNKNHNILRLKYHLQTFDYNSRILKFGWM